MMRDEGHAFGARGSRSMPARGLISIKEPRRIAAILAASRGESARWPSCKLGDEP
ncbi:MAG: HrpA-like RNA helicase [Qipengyuania sp.]|jgi:HrpA-like RNA helicase